MSGRAAAAALAMAMALALGGSGHAAETRPPDPYEILSEARARLQAGRVDAAGQSLAELSKLLAATPEWDPDGTLARQVIPALEIRIREVRRAVDRLDDLYQTAWVSRTIPEKLVRTASVRAYLDWSTGLVLELQQERDRILASVSAAKDRAVVYETPAYDRVRMVLETGVVRRMSGFAAAVTAELEEEAGRRDRLLRELASLEAGGSGPTAARERLVRDLERSRERIESYLDAFAALVSEGVPAPARQDDPRARAVNEVFAALLAQELETVRRAESQTASQQQARVADVARYREVNAVLAGVAPSGGHGERIDALERTIDDLPVVDSRDARPAVAAAEEDAPPGPALPLAAALVAGLAGLVLWHRWWHAPAPAPRRVDAVLEDASAAERSGPVPISDRDEPAAGPGEPRRAAPPAPEDRDDPSDDADSPVRLGI